MARPFLPSVALLALVMCFMAAGARSASADDAIETDLLIVGGSESAVAAAIQAARLGVKSITMVTDTRWLGGQFSSEGLAAIDENRGPEGYGHGVPMPRHGLFKEAIERIEALNTQRYGEPRPGNTRVITTARPADAAEVFEQMVKPYVDAGRLRIVRNSAPTQVIKTGAAVTAVRFEPLPGAQKSKLLTVRAKLTVDASDWGDVVKLAGAAYEFGPDLKEKYGEPEAPTSHDEYPITDMNPITYCMLIVETDTYEPIAMPEGYQAESYRKHQYPKDPMWLYPTRRVIDRYGFENVTHPDVLLLCFPAFDYPLDRWSARVAAELEATEPGASKKSIVELTRAQRQIVFEDAKRFSLGFLYYLQTEAHDKLPDKTHSFRRFVLSDEFGTADKLPQKPYVREGLRTQALYMMRQQDTQGVGGQAHHFANAMYHDTVASWQFEYDFHPTRREFLDGDDPAGPWRASFRPLRNWGPPYSGRSTLPLRSLVPIETDGLLVAGHNLGFSSIVSSAFRLHDQTMAAGQAAGAVAAVALREGVEPRALPFDAALMTKVWDALMRRVDGGQPAMLWPFQDLDPGHAAFDAVNHLAVRRMLPLASHDIDFRADVAADDAWRAAVVERTGEAMGDVQLPKPPAGPMTRGEFAQRWWAAVRDLPLKPYPRIAPDDADGDGVADVDDALVFDAANRSFPPFRPSPATDGLVDDVDAELPIIADTVRRFDFGPGKLPATDGFVRDGGEAFDETRGFGWDRDLSSSHRRRGAVPEGYRDTFIFTRTYDRWQCAVDNGRWHVTVCVGDSNHAQNAHHVVVEGKPAVQHAATRLGEFAERSVTVDVRDGLLTVELGTPGGAENTCVNWIRIVRLRGGGGDG